ncbi:hypothetical protein BDN67DRAFT_972524 [Paxillus ammoniavirescens]|nr:hypothetical protein BDN67DRAFT_972524 [Paxillus ammoniavirescens]
MTDFNPTSSPSPSPYSSPSPPSIPSWAICFIVIAFLVLFALTIFLVFLISNRIRPYVRGRLRMDDIERQRAEMVQRSREGVDGMDAASITTLVGPPPPVYAPKPSSPEPPLYRSTEDVSSVGRREGEVELGRMVRSTQQQQQQNLVLSSQSTSD